ncbi:hypothetical protein MN116_005244 [Schistosoma mekongi]|uniref:Uncharacterized protein n=1 Tax=Schistosoma mekongi TaxID=38744 RepID=A0AAE1ZEA7_SCHME|nr:hypothetical protein MN116_005244 [Schistosoma mekongi]
MSLILLLFESNFMEAHDFRYENSSYSALIENIWGTTFFGQSSRNPSFSLTVGVLVLFSMWFTSLLTIYFVRIYFKTGKLILAHEDLSKSREVLQMLEKNLSNQIGIYESEPLDDGITSYENDDYLDYLLKEVEKTAQRLADVNGIYIECQMKTYLPRLSCCRKKYLDEELCIMINKVNERVYNLKCKIITHYRRWGRILAAIKNSCTSFEGNSILASSTASLNTTFKTVKSNNEEIQSSLEEAYVNKAARHNLVESVTDAVDNKIKLHLSDKNESVIGSHYDIISQRFSELSCSSNDFTDSFNNIPHNNDARKQNSNRHSTKIPTFIHLSSPPPTPSRKRTFRSAEKKRRPLQCVDSRLLSPSYKRTSTSKRILSVAQSNDADFSFTGLVEKSRIPLVDFTNTITGIRKSKPVTF